MLPAAAALLAVLLAAPGEPPSLAAPDPEDAPSTAGDPDLLDEPPAAPEPSLATTATPPPAPPARASGQDEDNWLDVGHAFIEHRIFAPVLRVDRFFSDERDLEAERARSFLRWRQELRLQEHLGTPGYTTTVSANLKLPGFNKQLRRLRLEIAGQTRDAFTNLFPGDRAPAGDPDATDASFGTADAGIGYRIFETVASRLATHGDLGAGVMLQLPPGVYGRARLRFVEPLGRKVLARQALTGFWRTDTLFGATASADLERPLAASALTRLSGSTTLTERSLGYEWSGDLSVLGTMRSRIGAQLGFGLNGATGSPVSVDAYRFYLRVRRDFYRRWIFLELGPEYGWPWTPDRGRHAIWAVALRLEVQFQGNEAPRVPAPDAPAEPKDPPPAKQGARSPLPAAPAPG